jgi:hypothetical protein
VELSPLPRLDLRRLELADVWKHERLLFWKLGDGRSSEVALTARGRQVV